MAHHVEGQRSAACAGQRIEAIDVKTSAPSVTGVRNIPVVAQAARVMHVTTQEGVIRKFLALQEGDVCDELRRAESERILRAQPFLADASVQVVPNPNGTVNLVVRTADEISAVLSTSLKTSFPPLTGIRFGNSNLGGSGMYAAVSWRAGDAYRDAVGGQFVDNLFLARPYRLEVDGFRNTLGGDWNIEVAHAFITDLQRVAWRARWGGRADYTEFPTDTEDVDHSLRVERRYVDVGGIVRLGPPGRLSLFGASLTGNDEQPDTTPVLITSQGLRPDSGSELANRYVPHRSARMNLLWGVRDLGFVQVRGFDALDANQDLPIGFQLGTMFGRSLSILGSRDDDIFMSEDLYVGMASGRWAMRFQAQSEGRRSNDTQLWDGILASAHGQGYAKLGPRNTATASLEWASGWRQRVPFRLSLGGLDGVRGYGGLRIVGAERLIGRLEDRLFLGHPFNFGDFGVGAFTDAGRLWAGDAPYGQNTTLRPSIGVSLLGAVPSGSARLWRVDFALALSPQPGAGRFEVRFEGLDKTPLFLREPPDVEALRERTVPSSVFRWP